MGKRKNVVSKVNKLVELSSQAAVSTLEKDIDIEEENESSDDNFLVEQLQNQLSTKSSSSSSEELPTASSEEITSDTIETVTSSLQQIIEKQRLEISELKLANKLLESKNQELEKQISNIKACVKNPSAVHYNKDSINVHPYGYSSWN